MLVVAQFKLHTEFSRLTAIVKLLDFTVILGNRVGHHLIDSHRGAERRVGYYQVISYEIEKDNCIII